MMPIALQNHGQLLLPPARMVCTAGCRRLRYQDIKLSNGVLAWGKEVTYFDAIRPRPSSFHFSDHSNGRISEDR